jgi:Cu/Zn superoxide dismutase
MTVRSLAPLPSVLLAGLVALAASCSDEPTSNPGSGGSGGAASGGSAGKGGATSGGATSGGASSGGATSGGASSGGATSGGSAGAAQGGAAQGGSGGAPGGGTGGAAPDAVAVANIMATDGNEISGTATFTQIGTTVMLLVSVTNCPEGVHDMHIHLNKACGPDGGDAGSHWVPDGEIVNDITCMADGTGTLSQTVSDGTWTIGDGTDSDITTHSFMVHAAPPSVTVRIGCGLINEQ